MLYKISPGVDARSRIGVRWSCWAERAAPEKGPEMTTTRDRNYRRQPHTASFLQTFHTGMTEAQRMTASESDEQAALDFLTGSEQVTYSSGGVEFTTEVASAALTPVAPAAPRNDGSYLVEIEGHKVRCGGAYVSEKQAKWIIDIATTRVTPEGRTAESVLVRLEQGFAKSAGSQFITNYKDLPRKQPVVTASMAEAIAPGASTEEIKATQVEVPAGRYALRGEDGVVKFYRLDKPTQGKWAGYTFLKVQASDDLYPIRNKAEKARIIAEIGKDTLAAEQLYGRELGKCSRCGRTLTDETSRAYGIGPDCRNK